jgi:predicted porin
MRGVNTTQNFIKKLRLWTVITTVLSQKTAIKAVIFYKNSDLINRGCLPGHQYAVNSVADQSGARFPGDVSGAMQGLLGSHDLNGLIGGLFDVARTNR